MAAIMPNDPLVEIKMTTGQTVATMQAVGGLVVSDDHARNTGIISDLRIGRGEKMEQKKRLTSGESADTAHVASITG